MARVTPNRASRRHKLGLTQLRDDFKAHPGSVTWEELDVLRGLEGQPVLHPGDIGGREGQSLTDEGNRIVDGHGHFLVGILLRYSQDGGHHCEREAGRPWLTGSSLSLETLMTRTARTLGFSFVLFCARRVGNAAQGSQALLRHAATRTGQDG